MSPARRPQTLPFRDREVPPNDAAFRLVPGPHLQHELAGRLDLSVKPHALPTADQAGGGAQQVSELQADGPVHREHEQPRTGLQREDGIVQEVGIVRDQHPLQLPRPAEDLPVVEMSNACLVRAYHVEVLVTHEVERPGLHVFVRNELRSLGVEPLAPRLPLSLLVERRELDQDFARLSARHRARHNPCHSRVSASPPM
jgi:hypothetical protein